MRSEETLARTIYLVDADERARASTAQTLADLGYAVRPHEGFNAAYTDLQLRLDSGSAPPGSACFLLDIDSCGDVRQANGSLFDPAITGRLRGGCVPVIYMSATPTTMMVVTTIQEGAITFLEKPLDKSIARELARAFMPDAFQEAIRRANITAAISAAMAALQGQEGTPEHREFMNNYNNRLTDTEREICRCMIQGKSAKVTAREKGMAPKTVQNHRHRVLSKMDCDTTVALAAKAPAQLKSA